MSFLHNQKLWIATKENLKNAFLREKVIRQLKPINNRKTAHKHCGDLYVRYIILCNNLGELYDQTLQPQKRQMIENLLIVATNRLLELKNEMQKIEMSEFICVDNTLIELKMTRQNIEVLCPFYFPRKRDIEVQKIVDEITSPMTNEEAREATGLDRFRKILSPDEIEAQRTIETKHKTATIITTHENTRQARTSWFNNKNNPRDSQPKQSPPFPEVDYNFCHKPDQVPLRKIKKTEFKFNLFRVKQIAAKNYKFYEPPKYVENEYGQIIRVKEKPQSFHETSENDENDEKMEIEKLRKIEEENQLKLLENLAMEKLREKSAIVIQKAFRKYQLMKLVKIRHRKRLEICGLIPKIDEYLDSPDPKLIAQQNLLKRRERKREFDEKLVKILEDEKSRILKHREPFIMEDITDDIRQWFNEFYKGAETFQRYPEEFEGGTVLVLTGETKTLEEFVAEKNKTPDQKKKEKEMKRKEKKRKVKELKKQKEKDKKAEIERLKLEKKQGPTWNFGDEKHFEKKTFVDLEKLFYDCQNQWQHIDENRHELPIFDWIKTDAFADVHKQLRVIVDDFMRIELELLRVALSRDKRTKYIPQKRKKQPKRDKKKKKSPRETIDLVNERGLNECYQELKSMNIIRKFPRRSMDEFIGDQNFAANEMRALNQPTWAPHYGDIKNLLRTLLLGMGSIENLPKITSLCICGPKKCGKKLLVEALCSEMDAVVFDLSAKIVKQLNDLDTTLSLVIQVAKKLQPSVIFLDGAHKPFIKSIPPDEIADEPRKLGRFLFAKIAKKISANDAVLLIGTTNQPWNSNYVSLRACFQKFITFPAQLDYGTARMTWNEGLRKKKIYDFDDSALSALAMVTRNYSIGDILDFIDKHIDRQRSLRLCVNPLTSNELLEGLLTGPHQQQSIDEKTIKKFQMFANRTDSFYYKRTAEMARVQIIIDNRKMLEQRKKEAAAKKNQK